VAVQGAACSGDAALAPAPWPPRVPSNPRGGYAWSLVADLDVLASCEWCATLTAGSIAPWTVAADLLCANPGDICSDCAACTTAVDECPGTVTMDRQIDGRPHVGVRADRGPAWLSLTLGLSHSGTTCPGDATWLCHLEALESEPALVFADGFEDGLDAWS
jgi:hypothetical protein